MDEQQRVNEMFKNSYVPSIEDLHAGYICIAEIGDGAMWQNGVKLTPDGIRWVDAGIEKIRTPYLTAEQIEAEGWKLNEDKKYFYRFEKHFHYNTYYLAFAPKTKQSKEFLM